MSQEQITLYHCVDGELRTGRCWIGRAPSVDRCACESSEWVPLTEPAPDAIAEARERKRA